MEESLVIWNDAGQRLLRCRCVRCSMHLLQKYRSSTSAAPSHALDMAAVCHSGQLPRREHRIFDISQLAFNLQISSCKEYVLQLQCDLKRGSDAAKVR